MECLLSYIEIRQFQEYMINSSYEQIKIHDEYYKEIDLASNLPVSSIITDDVEQKKEEDNLKLKAYELYGKYMEQGSEFEINISWRQREALMNIFEDRDKLLHESVTINHIFELFERCKEEMFKLMEYSFS